MNADKLQRRRGGRLKRTAQGFTIMEVGIASVLGAMVMSGALMFLSDEFRTQVAQTTGQALYAINTAVNSYEAAYSVQLANNQAISIPGFGSVANIYSPTTTELFELGFLQTQTPQGTYGIKISPTLVGGVPSGLVWSAKAFVNGEGEVDQSLAGAAMLAAGGDAGISTAASPGTIQGVDGWTASNPIPGTPAGILAMRNGASSGAFMRLDGSTPMQGTINMNGNNVTNANTMSVSTVNAGNMTASGSITASGNISASGVYGQTLSVSGNGAVGQSLNVGNAVTAGGSIQGSSLVSTGDATIEGSGGTAVVAMGTSGNGLIAANNSMYTLADNGAYFLNNSLNGYVPVNTGTLTANGNVQGQYLIPQGYASTGGGCSPNGTMGTDGTQTLFCKNGVWVSGSSPSTYVSAFGIPGGAQGTWDMGWHNFCALSSYDTYQSTFPEVTAVAGPNSQGQYDWNMSTCNTGSGCDGVSYGTNFYCFDFNG